MSLSTDYPKMVGGSWPKFARKPRDVPKTAARVYLDAMCLEDGEEWAAGKTGMGGFLGGATRSIVFLPLISWPSDDQV